MGKVTTGTATEYRDTDADALEALVADQMEDLDEDDAEPQGVVHVTADIEWSGSYNQKAHRSTTLDGLDMTGVKRAVKASKTATRAAARASMAPPKLSLPDQVAQLWGNAAGLAAVAAAGLGVSPQTLRRWRSGTQRPSKANAARLADASARLHQRRAADARTAVSAARRGISDALTAAIRDRYGAEVRLFNISSLTIE